MAYVIRIGGAVCRSECFTNQGFQQVARQLGRTEAKKICKNHFTSLSRLSTMRPSFDGGIAQLGERLHGMQEVRGSIPRTSTKKAKEDSSGSPSSRGLGHYPFTVGTGVRIPVGTPRFLAVLEW